MYPGCLRENWQMHDSERLALTALLARRRPRCAIEIGTYQGGSLSLLSQYCEMVFSIDIDPDIPQKLRHLNNVSFLTGPSSAVLPLRPGRWFYRIRGVNDSLPGIQAMSWSTQVPIRIAAPKFAVVGG